jgi:error-prone DNA polymerase
MGFYAPAQLVRDAAEHGVEIRPVDVSFSQWDSTLEPDDAGGFALRLGFRLIKGFRRADAEALAAARQCVPAQSGMRLSAKAGLSRHAIELLAKADAYHSAGLDRRGALWQSKTVERDELPLFLDAGQPPAGGTPLPRTAIGEDVGADYAHLGLSLKAHPMALLRRQFDQAGVTPNAQLRTLPDGAVVRVAGLALIRQQPDTASGVIFATIEDETGVANIIVWPAVFRRCRRPFLASRLMTVTGRLQRDQSGKVVHIIASDIRDDTPLLRRLGPAASGREAARAIPGGRNFR